MEVSDPNHRYLRAVLGTFKPHEEQWVLFSAEQRGNLESYDPTPISLCKWTVVGVERDSFYGGHSGGIDIRGLGPARPLETVYDWKSLDSQSPWFQPKIPPSGLVLRLGGKQPTWMKMRKMCAKV